MAINKILKTVKELVKKVTVSEEVELFYSPDSNYKGYIVVINELEKQNSTLFYIKGSILKHIELEPKLKNKFNLGGKTAEIKGNKYINKIFCNKKTSFNTHSLIVNHLIAEISFNAMVEVINEDQRKEIIKDIEITQQEHIINKE